MLATPGFVKHHPHTTTKHRIASSLEDWQAALSPLLDEEDELARRSSALALKRREKYR